MKIKIKHKFYIYKISKTRININLYFSLTGNKYNKICTYSTSIRNGRLEKDLLCPL